VPMTEALRHDDHVAAARGVLSRRVATEQLLLHAETGAAYRLTGSAARLWGSFDEGTTWGRAIASFGKAAGPAGHRQPVPDASGLTRQLADRGLVVITPATARQPLDVRCARTSPFAPFVPDAPDAPDAADATGERPPMGAPSAAQGPVRGWRRGPRLSAYRRRLSSPTLEATVRWLVSRPFSEAPVPVTAPLPADGWTELLGHVIGDRIAPQLLAGIAAGLPASEAQQRQALAAARQAALRDLELERALLDLSAVFDGLRWRLIKGLAAARFLAPRRELRSTGDVDVVVHPRDYDEALHRLRLSGLVAHEYPAHGPASARQEHSRTFQHVAGVDLDVHRFVQGPLSRYRLPTAWLFEDGRVVDPRLSEQVLAPTAPVMILHAMLHLGTGRPGPSALAPLTTLLDLLYARRCLPDDHQRALVLATRSGCETPARWADEVVDGWRRSGAGRAGRDRGHRLLAFDLMLRTPGLRTSMQRFVGEERLRRSWEAVFPAAEFRRSHARTRMGHLRYIAHRFAGAGR
jgi:hypothetical protein